MILIFLLLALAIGSEVFYLRWKNNNRPPLPPRQAVTHAEARRKNH